MGSGSAQWSMAVEIKPADSRGSGDCVVQGGGSEAVRQGYSRTSGKKSYDKQALVAAKHFVCVRCAGGLTACGVDRLLEFEVRFVENAPSVNPRQMRIGDTWGCEGMRALAETALTERRH